MDYIESFKNLKTNNKYGRKSPHKAVMLFAVIEMFENKLLNDNVIKYNEPLKEAFAKAWQKLLPNEDIFTPLAYMPFWFLQSDSFWHIVPIRGKEAILDLMRDCNVKPTELKIVENVQYVELDEDLFFLMTLSSGRTALKRVILENYTSLSTFEIEHLSESVDIAADKSLSAMIDCQNTVVAANSNVSGQNVEKSTYQDFSKLDDEIQIIINVEYYSFLLRQAFERKGFMAIFPSASELYDKIMKGNVLRDEISPLMVFPCLNFLGNLKVSLLGVSNSERLLERIDFSIENLSGIENEDINHCVEKKVGIIPVISTDSNSDAHCVVGEPVEINNTIIDNSSLLEPFDKFDNGILSKYDSVIENDDINQLDSVEQQIRKYLIEHYALTDENVNYNDLLDEMGMVIMPNSLDALEYDIWNHLANISRYEVSHKRPMLSAVVGIRFNNMPGRAFFKLAHELGFGYSSELDNNGFAIRERERLRNYWLSQRQTQKQ